MKLIRTISRIIQEADEAYSKACESYTDEKTLDELERKYNESLKLLEIYKKMNKKNLSKK